MQQRTFFKLETTFYLIARFKEAEYSNRQSYACSNLPVALLSEYNSIRLLNVSVNIKRIERATIWRQFRLRKHDALVSLPVYDLDCEYSSR